MSGATVAALLRAYVRGDREGVDAIVSTSDPAALVDGLAEVATMLGQRAYGSAQGFDAGLADLLNWLRVFDAGRGGA